MAEQRFRSKVDPLMVVLCLGPLVALSLARLAGVQIGRSESGAPVVAVALAALIALSMATTRYIVSDDTLTVWFGPLRRRRPIRDIARLRATRSVESSPAWSLDRIEIGTTRGFWLNVSPADKAGFVRAVLARKPDVSLDEPLTRLLAGSTAPEHAREQRMPGRAG